MPEPDHPFARKAAPIPGAARRPLPALPDMELVVLAQQGSRQAFGELVRRHGSPVRVLLRRMGADPAAADDVGQDAFLIAYERIGEFRGEGGFCPWVRRIAARLYIKRWRKGARLEPLDEEDLEAEAARPDHSSDQRIDLEAALAGLSAPERVCVSLCYGAGLTHVEAAEALGSPVGTVKSHVKRGLEKLRVAMGSEFSAPPPPPGARMTETRAHG
ncbi:RNA polymerase sigma factor [soil metagenome]